METITSEQDARLDTWRAMALQRMPYLASILFAMRPVSQPGLRTFAVDEHWRLYIDFGFVDEQGWSDDMCGQVLLHEAGHLMGRHCERAKAQGVDGTNVRLAKIHNLASDLSINDDLEEAGCADLVDFGITPTKYGLPNHETVEWYYDKLLKKAAKQQCGTCGQPKAAQGQPGQGGPTCPECGQDVEFAGCGSGAGGMKVPGEQDQGAGVEPGLSGPEQELAITTAAERIRESAKSRGNVPAGLVEEAEQILKPSVVPWQRLLAVAVRRGAATRKGDEDTTFTRRNRRRASATIARAGGGRSRVIYPATVKPVPRVVVVRDTSGSMSVDDLNRVGAEVEAISRRLGVRGDELQVIDVDAMAYEPKRYAGLRSIAKISGRGGTDMRVGIRAAYAQSPRPNVVVVATDGYTPWPEQRTPGMSVVACITGGDHDVAKNVPAWIRTVVVDN